MNLSALHKPDRAALAAIGIAVAGYLFQLGLQTALRPYASEGTYFQEWSSEGLMQTVSLEDLRTEPLETLWSIHIQPPALDAIRAILARLWPASDPPTAVEHVDRLLYQLWSVCYGILGALVFLWMHELTDAKAAAVTALVVMLHPATLFYATFLDGTFLSALLLSLAYFLLWRARTARQTSALGLSLAVLALLFTRSLFQWPFVLVFGASLWLVGLPIKKTLTVLLVTGLVFSSYLAKQQHQFGLLSTSSLAGFSLARSVGIDRQLPNYWEVLDGITPSNAPDHLPRVLTRTSKIGGSPNFNHALYLEWNRHFEDKFLEYLRTASAGDLANSYLLNLRIYLQPSGGYTVHAIVDRIPWRQFYDRIFSAPILPPLLLLAGIQPLVVAFRRKQVAAYIGLTLPGMYAFLGSVLLDRGENMRFKFFLEPVLAILLISQLYTAWGRVRPTLVARMDAARSPRRGEGQ